MALVFTQTDLDNLKAAYVSGAEEVQIGDRKIRYKSQKDLLSAIQNVQNYLDGISTDVTENPNVVVGSYSRGE